MVCVSGIGEAVNLTVQSNDFITEILKISFVRARHRSAIGWAKDVHVRLGRSLYGQKFLYGRIVTGRTHSSS